MLHCYLTIIYNVKETHFFRKADQDTWIKERPRKTGAFSLGALGYIQTWLETPKGGMNS